MKRFKDWSWKAQIIVPIFYSIIICALFINDFVASPLLIKAVPLSLILLGYLFMLVARFQLKDKFSVLPQTDKGLETKGIYSLFSHPVYVFSCLATIGISFYLIVRFPQLPIFIFCLLFSLAYIYMQIRRAKREDKELLAKYGDKYKRYKQKTIF
jgi:protein-S-isoprenylcysteine O-methyltransferase Ste14